MGFLSVRHKSESFIVIEVGLSDALKCIHKIIPGRFFDGEFFMWHVQSFGEWLLFEVKVF